MKPDFITGETLLLDKPFDWSSFDLVRKVKFTLKKKLGLKLKVGHAGTLDPYATGLLVICTGKQTKQITQIQDAEKEYTGTIYLGATTPSYDLESPPQDEKPVDHITAEMIETARQSFSGWIMQRPPAFSAKKIDGKRAYLMARSGEEVVLDARPVEIVSFELGPRDGHLLPFKVVCSKGTYIRSLAHDLGQILGTGAYLASLRRTRIGNLQVEDALTVEAFLELVDSLNV